MDTTSYEIMCDEGHTITITVHFDGAAARVSFDTPNPSCVACQEAHKEAVAILQGDAARAGIATVRIKGTDGHSNEH